jgi:hypothetical protein
VLANLFTLFEHFVPVCMLDEAYTLFL